MKSNDDAAATRSICRGDLYDPSEGNMEEKFSPPVCPIGRSSLWLPLVIDGVASLGMSSSSDSEADFQLPLFPGQLAGYMHTEADFCQTSAHMEAYHCYSGAGDGRIDSAFPGNS